MSDGEMIIYIISRVPDVLTAIPLVRAGETETEANVNNEHRCRNECSARVPCRIIHREQGGHLAGWKAPEDGGSCCGRMGGGT